MAKVTIDLKRYKELEEFEKIVNSKKRYVCFQYIRGLYTDHKYKVIDMFDESNDYFESIEKSTQENCKLQRDIESLSKLYENCNNDVIQLLGDVKALKNTRWYRIGKFLNIIN